MELEIITVTEISQTQKISITRYFLEKGLNIEVSLFAKRKGTQHKPGRGGNRRISDQYNCHTL